MDVLKSFLKGKVLVNVGDLTKENVDAIVVGGRGKYLSSVSFLIGSTSSKLVHYGGHTIIIVK